MKKTLLILALIAVVGTSYAWNAMGHKLVAQIALDNLTPKAKQMCNRYTKAFVRASVWLDLIRSKKDVHWYDALHYIDISFSRDGSLLLETPQINALWGINQAMAILSSDKSSRADKRLALRVLIHVVGDVHQPLHTAALVSQELLKGDRGGNLFPLGKNSISPNLHSYWDKGGGALAGRSNQEQIRNKARQLESRWSCKAAGVETKPEQWIQASHQLALEHAYNVRPGDIPSKKYQLDVQNISQRQILRAGCRLAQILNLIQASAPENTQDSLAAPS